MLGHTDIILTTMNGKTIPIAKQLIQFTDPPIMKAAARPDWVNNSVVRVFVTPPKDLRTQLAERFS